jgi:hypothetical protein
VGGEVREPTDLSIERIRGDAEEAIDAAFALREVWKIRPITTDPDAAVYMNRIFTALARLDEHLEGT